MTSPRHPNTRTQTLGAPGKLWGVPRVGRWARDSVWALGLGRRDSAFMEGSGSLWLCRGAACAPHTSPRMLDPPEFTWGRTAGGLLLGGCWGCSWGAALVTPRLRVRLGGPLPWQSPKGDRNRQPALWWVVWPGG